jgi:hypothetical protein
MKTRPKFLFYGLPVFVSLLIACTKDVTVPDLKGSLVGYVYTFDEYGNRVNENQDVEIAAIAGPQHYNLRTDQTGRFEFKNLPSGTYDLEVEKEGFGMMKQYGIQHLGGKPTLLINAYFLYRPSAASITDLSIEDQDSGDRNLYATINFNGNHPEYVQVILYFSKNKGFDIASTTDMITVDVYPQDNLYKGFVPPMEVNFQAGETWYYRGIVTCSAYGVHDRGAFLTGFSYYFDYPLNKTIYPNASVESSEFTFMPE